MKTRAVAIVSTLVAAMFGGAVFMLLVQPVALDANQSTMLNVLLGVLSTAFGSVVNFWLGSSSGSKAKDQVISDISKGAPHENQQ